MNDKSTLSPKTAEKLSKYRIGLISLAILEGIGCIIIILSMYVILNFCFDWLLEPNYYVRQALLFISFGVLFASTYRYIITRGLFNPAIQSIALMIERRNRSLSDALMTSVELSTAGENYSGWMVQRAIEQSEQQFKDRDFQSPFLMKPILFRWLIALGFLVVFSSIVLADLLPLQTWIQRTVWLEDVRYPRKTHLELVGFEDHVRKIAIGQDAQIRVIADKDYIVPEKCFLKYRMSNTGAVTRWTPMDKQGDNQFVMTLNNVLEPIELDVYGGDDGHYGYRLEIVDAPILDRVSIEVQYPQYTQIKQQTIEYKGVPVELPFGSNVTIRFKSNKELKTFKLINEAEELSYETISNSEFVYRCTLQDSLQLAATWIDLDSIESETEFRVSIVSVLDQAPQIVSKLKGIGDSVTRIATIPIDIEARDDYGLEELSVQFDAGEEKMDRIPIPLLSDRKLEFKTDETPFKFQVTDLDMTEGEKLKLTINGMDNNSLNGPNSSNSQDFVFDVVTPDELLSRIATRELVLRQRFEQILDEMTGARDQLVNMKSKWLIESGEKDIVLFRLEAEQIVQTLRKNQNEISGIHTGFDQILQELENNKAGSENYRERLKSGIITPLHGILNVDMPDLDKSLVLFSHSELQLGGSLETNYESSLSQLNQIVNKCRSILESMRKLETFHEAVDLLRTLIAEQNSLMEKTKEERKNAIRNLFDDD